MQTGQLTEGSIEQEIKNLVADKYPRLTPETIDNRVAQEHYWMVPGTTTIVCCLVLANGFTVIGKAACASPENFKPEIGRKIAFDDARNKIWELEGYLLKQKLADSQKQADQLEFNFEDVYDGHGIA